MIVKDSEDQDNGSKRNAVRAVAVFTSITVFVLTVLLLVNGHPVDALIPLSIAVVTGVIQLSKTDD